MISVKLFYLAIFLALLLVADVHGRRRNSNGGEGCSRIHAAVKLPNFGETIFMDEYEYIEYNHRWGAEGSVKNLRRLQVGSRVQAAFTHPDGSMYFLNGCSYRRYNASPGLPLRLLGRGETSTLGLPCDVDAGVMREGQLMAFKGCDVYTYSVITETFQTDGTLTDRRLPCQLDAAVEWDSGSAIFIKGHQFWQWLEGRAGAEETPRHIDLLNICSWYLCGEADWMRVKPRRRDITTCNGDSRLCPLRLDQVTLPGLHNAGAGFAGGFGFLNCWVRNHGKNITEQLSRGIRHLDVDPCYDTCGILGTCHTMFCGGSLCAMIKQIRAFMRENPYDVISVNFNHEIVDESKVFKELTRQLNFQLGPMLNNRYRLNGGRTWPTLQRSIRKNRRVFVFYAPIVLREEHRMRYYNRHKWIHDENLFGSTWRPFSLSAGCQPMVPLTSARCSAHQYRELVEVSVIPESGGSCTSTTAAACKPYIDDMLQACQPHRFRHNKSPNVVLVDWPEVDSDHVTSVYHAVRHQNVRNLLQHRPNACRVQLDAAVHVTNTARSLFFVGQEVVEFNHDLGSQVNSWPLGVNHNGTISAAYYDESYSSIMLTFSDCTSVQLDPNSLEPVSESTMLMCTPETIDATVVWQGLAYKFTGCLIQSADSSPSFSVSQWGFPCDVDAALERDGTVYAFKGNNYYRYPPQQTPGYIPHRTQTHAYAAETETETLSQARPTVDWKIDVVRCQ